MGRAGPSSRVGDGEFRPFAKVSIGREVKRPRAWFKIRLPASSFPAVNQPIASPASSRGQATGFRSAFSRIEELHGASASLAEAEPPEAAEHRQRPERARTSDLGMPQRSSLDQLSHGGPAGWAEFAGRRERRLEHLRLIAIRIPLAPHRSIVLPSARPPSSRSRSGANRGGEGPWAGRATERLRGE